MFVSSTALAGALNPIGGVGARGRTMESGIAMVNDASIFYYNPSLLAFTPNFASAGIDYINASFEYKTPTGQKFNSTKGEHFIPLAGMNYRLNSKTAIVVSLIKKYY